MENQNKEYNKNEWVALQFALKKSMHEVDWAEFFCKSFSHFKFKLPPFSQNTLNKFEFIFCLFTIICMKIFVMFKKKFKFLNSVKKINV